HSSLMAEAKAKLAALIDFLPDRTPQNTPVSRLVCNVSGAELPVENLKSSILQHLISPVQWLPGLQYVAQNGVTRYLEISPKNVLSYLTQRAGLPMRSLCEPDELFTFMQTLDSK
ncbi:ACP S-malonyltransferase, partial [Xenorhabdus bovienii]|nr:ACP S-malonyltransferase [Xenorhabdus bovienii]